MSRIEAIKFAKRINSLLIGKEGPISAKDFAAMKCYISVCVKGIVTELRK